METVAEEQHRALIEFVRKWREAERRTKDAD
jgi:hypothetical protein